MPVQVLVQVPVRVRQTSLHLLGQLEGMAMLRVQGGLRTVNSMLVRPALRLRKVTWQLARVLAAQTLVLELVLVRQAPVPAVARGNPRASTNTRVSPLQAAASRAAGACSE